MIIRLKDHPHKHYVVYAIYWGTNFKIQQRYYYVVEPEDGVGGFSPLGEDEIIIVDNSLENYSLINENPGISDFFYIHNAAFPLGDLFDYLSENGYPEKVDQLFENMRKMGLNP